MYLKKLGSHILAAAVAAAITFTVMHFGTNATMVVSSSENEHDHVRELYLQIMNPWEERWEEKSAELLRTVSEQNIETEDVLYVQKWYVEKMIAERHLGVAEVRARYIILGFAFDAHGYLRQIKHHLEAANASMGDLPITKDELAHAIAWRYDNNPGLVTALNTLN
jgi:hypothetical protein